MSHNSMTRHIPIKLYGGEASLTQFFKNMNGDVIKSSLEKRAAPSSSAYLENFEDTESVKVYIAMGFLVANSPEVILKSINECFGIALGNSRSLLITFYKNEDSVTVSFQRNATLHNLETQIRKVLLKFKNISGYC